MKRFLSWIVTGISISLVYYPFDWLFRLICWGVGELADLSKLVLVLVVLFAGGTILSVIGWLIFIGSGLLAMASQAICKSKNGGRYALWGTVCIIRYVFVMAMAIVGVAQFSTPLHGYGVSICMVLFGIAFIFLGKSKAQEDGPPKSKKEVLQEKLAKEEAKEEKAAALEALKEMERKGIDIKAVIAEAEGKSRLEEQQDGHNT